MIPGIDISHRQNEIDWPLVKKAGIRFAFYNNRVSCRKDGIMG